MQRVFWALHLRPPFLDACWLTEASCPSFLLPLVTSVSPTSFGSCPALDIQRRSFKAPPPPLSGDSPLSERLRSHIKLKTALLLLLFSQRSINIAAEHIAGVDLGWISHAFTDLMTQSEFSFRAWCRNKAVRWLYRRTAAFCPLKADAFAT